jgi:hypothetical protein
LHNRPFVLITCAAASFDNKCVYPTLARVPQSPSLCLIANDNGHFGGRNAAGPNRIDQRAHI